MLELLLQTADLRTQRAHPYEIQYAWISGRKQGHTFPREGRTVVSSAEKVSLLGQYHGLVSSRHHPAVFVCFLPLPPTRHVQLHMRVRAAAVGVVR